MSPRLTGIYQRLLEVLGAHPEGIPIGQIRRELGLAQDEQQHLDRRIRHLDQFYDIKRVRRGRDLCYQLAGEKAVPVDAAPIDKTTRSRILHLAGYRCQSCGRSVAEDGVKLQIDHKVPRAWGGPTVDENLWALCSECNEGKRNFFASITDERVQQALAHGPIHVRIGELLKAFAGEPVPKRYIQIVAYTHDDYEKRTRELRKLGWAYHTIRKKERGRVQTYFVLDEWQPWPDDAAAAIRASEAAERAARPGS